MSFPRSDFPVLRQTMNGHPLVYLDSAATALKPQIVIDTISDFYSSYYGTVHRSIYTLSQEATERYSRVRKQVQLFLNAASLDEIIFTKGSTESINLVAYSFGQAYVRSGDEIIISGLEHHSNIIPWKLLCERTGAHLKVIPLLDDGTLDLNAYLHMLSSRTKLLSISHVSNVLGILNPVKFLIQEAHRVGAKVFLDGAQSSSHLAIDVQDLGCDFFCFSGHKLYGPTGVGILYGKYDLLKEMPPFQSGGDMIRTVSFDQVSYQFPPLKFEAGTPMIAEVIGLGAALDYLSRFSIQTRTQYEKDLLDYALHELFKIPDLSIFGPLKREVPIISFRCQQLHPLDMAAFLNFKGFALRSGNLCAQPLLNHFGVDSVIRLSIAPYNTYEDIESFISELKNLIYQVC